MFTRDNEDNQVEDYFSLDFTCSNSFKSVQVRQERRNDSTQFNMRFVVNNEVNKPVRWSVQVQQSAYDEDEEERNILKEDPFVGLGSNLERIIQTGSQSRNRDQDLDSFLMPPPSQRTNHITQNQDALYVQEAPIPEHMFTAQIFSSLTSTQIERKSKINESSRKIQKTAKNLKKNTVTTNTTPKRRYKTPEISNRQKERLCKALEKLYLEAYDAYLYEGRIVNILDTKFIKAYIQKVIKEELNIRPTPAAVATFQDLFAQWMPVDPEFERRAKEAQRLKKIQFQEKILTTLAQIGSQNFIALGRAISRFEESICELNVTYDRGWWQRYLRKEENVAVYEAWENLPPSRPAPGFEDSDSDSDYDYDVADEEFYSDGQRRPQPASEESLQKLKLKKFSKTEKQIKITKDQKEEEEEEEEVYEEDDEGDCAICYDQYQEGDTILQLPCSHYFHQDCSLKWFKKKNTCPMCRIPI